MEEIKSNGTQFEGKEEYIKDVFTEIASYYDEMNEILSLHTIENWHKYMIKIAGNISGKDYLDVGTGTGRIAFRFQNAIGPSGRAVGLDLTPAMLHYAEKQAEKENLSCKIEFVEGNALSLPFEDNSFDIVTSGYMLRNVTDIQGCIDEMFRALRPGGKVIVAEMATPDNRIIRQFYNIYMNRRVRRIARKYDSGKSIRGKQPAYDWLTESIKGFPHGKVMEAKFKNAGFVETKYHNKMFGACCIYEGRKPE